MRNAPIGYLIFLTFLVLSCQNEDPFWNPLLVQDGLNDFKIINGSATYERQGNTIIGTTKSGTPNTFLATKKNYGDFELRFEVKLSPGLNSGVQLRSISDPEIKKGVVHGYQVEIEDSKRGWAGGIYDEQRRGWLNPLEWNPKGRAAFEKGAWNKYHIVAKADTFATWVNGVPCSFLIDDMTASGLIGLQVHSIYDSAHVNKTIEWKNLEIKTEQVGKDFSDFVSMDFPKTIMTSAVEKSTEEFIVKDGYSIFQVAGEPQVENPVAAVVDKAGSFWVVELPGYMRDVDGSDEDRPDGKIVVLSDVNNDGKVDRRVIFKDGLVAPRTLCLAYNGLLYTNGKALHFEDFETGENIIVDSSYVYGGNIEHQSNGLLMNIDNWIYSAKSKYRYRRDDGVWKKEKTSLRGQWGLSADQDGRLVYNNNSNGLQGDRAFPNTLIKNDFLKVNKGLQNQLCANNKVYPYQATALNRAYLDGVVDETGKLINMTSACSPLVLQGSTGFKGSAFTCVPEINALKQYSRKADQFFHQDYVQTISNEEFLISKDESFRPVNLFAHRDNGFFAVDLRKGIIQHRAYMTHYLREIVLEKKLDQIKDKGRLYWIYNNQATDNFSFRSWEKNASDSLIVSLLSAPSMELRRTAQKHIVGTDNENWMPLLKQAIVQFSKAGSIFGVIHSLWTLEGIGAIEQEHLKLAKNMGSLQVNYHILNILSQNIHLIDPQIVNPIFKLGDNELDLQLCHLLPNQPPYTEKVNDLIRRYENSELHAEALLCHLPLNAISSAANQGSKIMKMLSTVKYNIKEENKEGPIAHVQGWIDRRNEGFPAYNKYCSSCHGADGRGQDNLAPPVLHSQYVEGNNRKLAALILQGIEGPIHVNDKLYEMNLVMPGLKHNEDISDETISGIIAFVNNAFSKGGKGVSPEEVGEIREKLKDRTKMLTEEEVFAENAW